MGKRAFLINDQTLTEIFQNRGPGWGAMVRIAGEQMPADAKLSGLMYVAPIKAFALIYESPTWSELVVPGQRGNNINGIPVVDNAKVVWLFLIPHGSTVPGCGIPGIDFQEPITPPTAEGEPCATNEG